VTIPKQWLFRLSALGLGVTLAFTFGEWWMQHRQRAIAASDQMDPGLVRYDPHLGWVLSASWKGAHRNFDFDVRYSISGDAWRSSTRPPGPRGTRRIAVMGDSFTFGLGVNDGETFVERLNAVVAPGVEFVNCGVPGYSTDQELLLLEREVLALRPAAVVLVVYVANDLLDNQYAFPLQAAGGKPFFGWGDDRLVLQNDPVPQTRKSGADAERTLAAAVFGETPPGGWKERWFGGSTLVSTLLGAGGPDPDQTSVLAQRLQPSVKLFSALIGRMSERCREAGVGFELTVLSGRSHIEEPGSASAQYQEYYRQAVLRVGHELGLRCVDLTQGMLGAERTAGRKLYYPHDGHLTPTGHGLAARLLREQLQCLRENTPGSTDGGATR